MPLIDFDKLSQEFDMEDDFGFSAVSEEEYNSVINKTAETAEDYKARLILNRSNKIQTIGGLMPLSKLDGL